MSFEHFLKSHKIKREFNTDPESTISAYQDIINEILLKNTYLVDDYFDRLISEDEISPKDILPLISSLKSLFDIWQSITGVENEININRAFDVLIKEGYDINLSQEKIDQIHATIKENTVKI